MNKLKEIEFKIKNTKDIIDSFEKAIERNESKPRTRKRNFYIGEYRSIVKNTKEKIRLLEIEKERLEKEGGNINE